MRSLVGHRLPKLSKDESTSLNKSFDFLGLNYYSANYVADVPPLFTPNASSTTDGRTNLTVERNGVPIGPKAASDFLYVYPRGIRDLLLYVKRTYNNPIVYITENGIDEYNNSTLPLHQQLADTARIDYYYRHLSYVGRAIRDGVRLKGYFAWSLLDNFEWSSGYTVRFGLNYVDYEDGLKRYPKLSANWFKKFLSKD